MTETLGKDIRRIVIIGHSGFVGSKLMAFFKERYPDKELIGLSTKEVDLTDVQKSSVLSSYFDHTTLVLFVAGIKSNYGTNLDTFAKNVVMAQTVCRALSERPVKRLLFFSSIAVYGVDKHDTNISERTVPILDTHYGLAKYATEVLLTLQLAKAKDTSLVIIRPPTIYGPCERIIAQTPSGFLTTYLNGGEVTLWDDGSEVREFLFINDLIRMVELLSFNDFAGIINLSGGKAHSYKEAIDVISKLLGRTLVVRSKQRTKEKVDKAYDGRLFLSTFPHFKFTPLEEGLAIILKEQKK